MEKTRQYIAAVPLFLMAFATVLVSLAAPSRVGAFCGFYVATGDMRIYNRASKVVIARDGDRTVLTMSSDFRGDPKEFAVVIPVPVVLAKGQVHIGDSTAVTHLDDYSVPRLVEYTDPNPCPEPNDALHFRGGSFDKLVDMVALKSNSSTRQVIVEAQYKVDEYEVVILSSKE